MGESVRDDAVVVAIDQGTSSTKALVLDRRGAVTTLPPIPLGRTHPAPGWVEQDAEEILASVVDSLTAVCEEFGEHVAAVGLSNQRESVVVWDRATGAALGPVIGWQDRRAAGRAVELALDHAEWVRRASGLPLDPMFSALKLQWILDEIDPDRRRSVAGEIAVGTVDSWLLFRLTGEHRIEAGNASRTQLLNIETGRWDERLLRLFSIPHAVLPRVVPSDAPSALIEGIPGTDHGIRVRAVLGDSHAALFAHGARRPGSVKVTYGTGSSVMGIAADGGQAWDSHALVETIAWARGEHVTRAFEGNVLATGATVHWLAQLFDCDVDRIDRLARTVPDAGGVTIVPAFAGIGAPWWDPAAKAVMTGFDLGTNPGHVARAAFDSIAFQIEDVVRVAEKSLGIRIPALLADGGPSRNDWLMQLQADVSSRTVQRSENAALSGLGAAHLAGLAAGVWSDSEVDHIRARHEAFEPGRDPVHVQQGQAAWRNALSLSLGRSGVLASSAP